VRTETFKAVGGDCGPFELNRLKKTGTIMNNGVERLALMDIVIKNGTILTMDPENRVYEKGFLGVTGDTISHVGTDGSMPPHGKKVIDARGGLVLPGLVNGHTHAAMTLFRGLADDLPLMDWLNNYIFPVESRMDADFVYTGSLLACAEMIMSGTTSFCDMYLFEQEVARAAHEAGMRCIVGEVLYDFDSPNYGSVENGLKYTEELIRQWSEDPLVSVAVEPHSLFTPWDARAAPGRGSLCAPRSPGHGADHKPGCKGDPQP